MSYSRTQHSDASECGTAAIRSRVSTLPLSHCAPQELCKNLMQKHVINIWADQEGGRGSKHPVKSQVAIGFLRNTGTDSL